MCQDCSVGDNFLSGDCPDGAGVIHSRSKMQMYRIDYRVDVMQKYHCVAGMVRI
jgi:hypothetical protein